MRYKEPFTLYPRKMKNGKSVWYYRTYDADGKRNSGRSTGLTSKTAARLYVTKLIKSDEIDLKDNPRFRDYAAKWWLWDECAYVRGRRARGSISRSYVDANRGYLVHHILPYFGDKRVRNISPSMIEEWLLGLRDKDTGRGGTLRASTINSIYGCLKMMFREGFRMQVLVHDPTQIVRPLRDERQSKSFLELEEFRLLFAEADIDRLWDGDLRFYAGNLLAASTGMRPGEVLGLLCQYVQPGHVAVEHTWARKYGLRLPKAGSRRKVPVPTKTEYYLRHVMEQSPYIDPEAFVFWGPRPNSPVHHKAMARAFYRAMERIGISDAERRTRNITEHGWRYFFNTYMRTKVPDPKLQQLTGHSSDRMTEHYTRFNLEDLRDVVQIQEDLIGDLEITKSSLRR